MTKIETGFSKNIIITADMKLVTGLHIGGIKDTVEIGGVDNPVIMGWRRYNNEENPKRVPIIPGSSIKGKMRSLLDIKYAEDIKKEKPNEDKNNEYMQVGSSYIKYPDSGKGTLIPMIFGVGASENSGFNRARIIFRDAYPTPKTIEWWEKKEDVLHGTEVKAENTINRITSAANPRFFERVPAESVFKVDFVLSVYEGDNEEEFLGLLFEGLRLLQDNYIGGSGSRGYGKVVFSNFSAKMRTADDYMNGKDGTKYDIKKYENMLKDEIESGE